MNLVLIRPRLIIRSRVDDHVKVAAECDGLKSDPAAGAGNSVLAGRRTIDGDQVIAGAGGRSGEGEGAAGDARAIHDDRLETREVEACGTGLEDAIAENFSGGVTAGTRAADDQGVEAAVAAVEGDVEGKVAMGKIDVEGVVRGVAALNGEAANAVLLEEIWAENREINVAGSKNRQGVVTRDQSEVTEVRRRGIKQRIRLGLARRAVGPLQSLGQLVRQRAGNARIGESGGGRIEDDCSRQGCWGFRQNIAGKRGGRSGIFLGGRRGFGGRERGFGWSPGSGHLAR